MHVKLFKLSRGRIGDRLVDNDMLLLTTTGVDSGEPHTVPLLYLEESGSYLVIASYGGRPDHPQWYKNLLAEPRVTLQIRGDEIPAIARPATPEERSPLWERVKAAYHGYQAYQSRTSRQIPVVFLTPVG